MKDLKSQGNAAISAGDFDLAIEKFSEAIKHDMHNHVLYSNRSAAYCHKKDYDNAIKDANEAIRCNPGWPKGYGRLASAYYGLEKRGEAKDAYKKGLMIDPTNKQFEDAINGMETVSTAKNNVNHLNPFTNLEIFETLYSNAIFRNYLKYPEVYEAVLKIFEKPDDLYNYLKHPRVSHITALAYGKEINQLEDDIEITNMKTQEEIDQFGALIKKSLGNRKYKMKCFDEAIQYYDEALKLDPLNVIVMNNKAAVFFEQGKYDDCIKLCNESIEIGEKNKSDFKTISKALARIAAAYAKKEEYQLSIDYYKKAIVEHRSKDYLQSLKEVENKWNLVQKERYRNPEISEQERNVGNELFKKGDYVKALKHYTEAIKRNDTDHRAYGNRAACYLKLLAPVEAIRDCEKCIELDPTIIKAYLRKASALFIMKQYQKSIDTCTEALKQKTVDQTTRSELENQIQKAHLELYKKNQTSSPEEALKNAMNDPELAGILTDPTMQHILSQMQTNPQALMEHMKNPQVCANIQKLVSAGVIRFGDPKQ